MSAAKRFERVEVDSDEFPNVLLIGAGVVGNAVAATHFDCQIPFVLADQQQDLIDQVGQELMQRGASIKPIDLGFTNLPAIAIDGRCDQEKSDSLIVIESIVEQLSAKQSLFAELQRRMPADAVLCSNTSTLQISDIAATCKDPQQICGLHFFMPVQSRWGVELIVSPETSQHALDTATRHAEQIGKRIIRCCDGPGFVVNRMLSPYLNQALLLLCRGAKAEQLEHVARAYGMPLSPIELIDWIGIPTMYHAGKVFWSAFPQRIDPSPVIPAMLKRKLLGRAVGRGFYTYEHGVRSESICDDAIKVINDYRVDCPCLTDGDVLELLSIPMWNESKAILHDGVADSMATIDAAMSGGLGYCAGEPWSEFFQSLGQSRLEKSMSRWASQFRSMRPYRDE